MKILIIAFITNFGAAYAAPIIFPQPIIKEVEQKYISKYKNLNDKQKQEKYLIAISELSELGDFAGAIYLAESGYKFKNPTLEYYDVFLSLLKRHGTKERYNEVFNDLFHDNFRLKNDEEKDLLGDILLDYLLLNQMHSHELKPRIENIYKSIKSEYFSKRSIHVQAIVFAKQRKYKEALRILKPSPEGGLEDLIFMAFLQKMNDAPVSIKSQTLQNIYGDLLKLIEVTPSSILIDTLKGHEDIMESTPLYEVLK